jgi:hypothetical protein
VHRDVKPENVLFSSLGHPKLVDFGIARMRTAFETRSGSVSATLNHAAPEIIGGRPATPQADVYSLGSVLFFALTGAAPFDREGDESLAPLIARIVGGALPDLRERGVPDELAAVIERALEKEPEDRYPTAAAFGEALRAAAPAVGAPVPAVPVKDVAPIPGMADAFAPDRNTTPRVGTVHVQRNRVEPVADAPAPSPGRRRRPSRLLVAVAAAVVLAVAGVAIGLAATRTGTTTAAAETPLRLTDAVQHGDGLDVRRGYDIADDGSTIGSSVRLVNTTTSTSKLVWFEVIPPELATSLGDVSFSVKPDGAIDGTLIAYWVLTLAPGGEQPLSWRTPFPTHEQPSMTYLKRLRLLMATEAANTKDKTDAKRAELAATTGASAEAAVPVGPVAPGQDTSVIAQGGGGSGGVVSSGGGGGVAPVGGGVVPGGGAGTAAGAVVPGGGTGGTGGGAAPAPAPAVNHAPAVSAGNQGSSELDSIAMRFSASDPDGDPVSFSIRGLPAGLSAGADGSVGGRISAGASSLTQSRASVATQNFSVTVTATDSKGASNSATITWSVRDTYTTMPNYIDQFGCACNGRPDVDQLSNHTFTCAYDPSGDGNHIYRQSIAPGTVIAWGQAVTYWYGKNDSTCAHVAKGW